MNAAFIALIICNLVMLIVGAFGARYVTKVLRMPEQVLLAMVMILSLVGSYGVSGKMFDVLVTLLAGVFGYFLRMCNVPTAPVIIGLVLGPILEETLRQGLILKDNNFLAFFTLEHPVAIVLMLITFFIITWSGYTEFRQTKSNVSK